MITTNLIKVFQPFPRLWSKLFDGNVKSKPEAAEVCELMLIDPDFFREQEGDESNSKHVRTYNC